MLRPRRSPAFADRSGRVTGVINGLLWVTAGVFWICLIIGFAIRPVFQLEIAPGSIRPDVGRAYIAPVFDPWVSSVRALGVFRANFKLLEDGGALKRSQNAIEQIRDVGGGLYAQSASEVRFSSGNNTDPRSNGSRYVAVAEVEPGTSLIWLALFISALAVVVGWKFDPSFTERATRRGAALLSLGILAAFVGVSALMLLYLGTIVSGLLSGTAVPATFIVSLFPTWRLNALAHSIPYALLIAALVGAAATWSASPAGPSRRAIRRTEILGLRLSGRIGLAFVTLSLVFILAAGGWSNSLDLSDSPDLSPAGMIPYSDASTYFRGVFDMAYGGKWGWIASSRAAAASLRDLLTVLAGYSYPASLLVQLLALSGALYFATWSVTRWLGLWSGVAFLALGLVLARPFLPTTMSEPLSLIWSFVAVGFLADALRTKSSSSAMLAVLFLTMAQLTRMGAVLVIGIAVVWAALWLASSLREMLKRSSLALLAVLLPLFLASGLKALYGTPSKLPLLGGFSLGGWNFPYLVCELARFTQWRDCFDMVESRVRGHGDANQAEQVQRMFWQALVADPLPVISKLASNIAEFVVGLPRTLLLGYRYEAPDYHMPLTFLVVLLPGLAFYLMRRASRGEVAFWGALFLTMALSSAMVFFIDGWRALYATHPLVAAFAVIGLAARSSVRSSRPAIRWRPAASCATIAAGLLLITPTLSHRLLRDSATNWRAEKNAATIAGGDKMTGFLVQADEAKAITSVPSLSISSFTAMIEKARLEAPWRQSFIARLPPPPFALVWSPQTRLRRFGVELYVAPAFIFGYPDVREWLLELEEPAWQEQSTIAFVTRASPRAMRHGRNQNRDAGTVGGR